MPPDLVVALNPMRAWDDDRYRGTDGSSIMAGEQGLVLMTG